jgi:NDP-sugar pyrophosphorylase family protein
MKALILAAGFGKRLLPYTKVIPKPLFTVNSKPVIEHTIKKLIQAGCSEIKINTHHLNSKIEDYIKKRSYPVKVETIFEPEILETGGALKNVKTFLKGSDFIVINSDILFDIDLSEVIKSHLAGNCLASLVLHKHDTFNMIEIGKNNLIKNFNSSKNPYAFTGIQILSPKIFALMPDKKTFSIIDLYQSLIKRNYKIKAFILKGNYFWEDIGNIKTYKYSCMKYLARSIENTKENNINKIDVQKLAGDGSDREWFRITANKKTYIAADHGINTSDHYTGKPGRTDKSNNVCQLDSFVNIGHHIFNKGLSVPEIYTYDPFSGIAIVEDLGNQHLEKIINNTRDEKEIFNWYKKVCDSLFLFSREGFKGFKKQWAFQTYEYSKEVIIENECRYFIDTFANIYLKKDVRLKAFIEEFEFIAENCIDSSFKGLMHRDMQSKNIMVRDDLIYFIDFQSARKGPIEYDIASLLIDPYVQLGNDLKKVILSYFLDKIISDENIDAKHFKHCYKYCCVTRNLQILGAFSFLSRIKNKKWFEEFIPHALKSLKEHINLIDINKTPKLNKFINNLEI